MPTLQEIMLRAQALRQETAVDSISPERAGSIMYDTLAYINQMQLQGANPLLISKIYASVAAMEADSAPVSDLTGQPLRAGQVVCIASGDPDDPDEGMIYRYDGTEGDVSSWTACGRLGSDAYLEGYQYMGVAKLTPAETDPGVPTQKVFYLASEPGTYENFDNLVVADGEVAIFKFNGAWSKEVTGAITNLFPVLIHDLIGEFDLTGISPSYCALYRNNGNWYRPNNNYLHKYLDISAYVGRILTITANANNEAIIGFLTEYGTPAAGVTPSYADGGCHIIPAGNTQQFIIPAGTTILVVNYLYNNVDATPIRLDIAGCILDEMKKGVSANENFSCAIHSLLGKQQPTNLQYGAIYEGNNNWYRPNSSYIHAVFSCENMDGKVLSIKGNATSISYLGFLTQYTVGEAVSGATPNYADSGKHIIQNGTITELTIPTGTKFVVVNTKYNNVDCTPQVINIGDILFEESKNKIATLEETTEKSSSRLANLFSKGNLKVTNTFVPTNATITDVEGGGIDIDFVDTIGSDSRCTAYSTGVTVKPGHRYAAIAKIKGLNTEYLGTICLLRDSENAYLTGGMSFGKVPTGETKVIASVSDAITETEKAANVWIQASTNLVSESYRFYYILIVDLGVAGDTFYNVAPEVLAKLVENKGFRDEYVVSEFGRYAIEARCSDFADVMLTHNGEKLVTLGDSITWQCKWQEKLVEQLGYDWSKEETQNGSVSVVPMGAGGSVIRPFYNNDVNYSYPFPPSPGAAHFASIHNRSKQVKYLDPDVIVIMGGQNDGVLTGGSLGTISDAPYLGDEVDLRVVGESGVPSFYSAYKGILQILSTDCPKARIFCATTMRDWRYIPSEDYRGKQYVLQAIKECAALYGARVVDLYEDASINEFNAHEFFQADNTEQQFEQGAPRVHPNDAGGLRMAELMINIMR